MIETFEVTYPFVLGESSYAKGDEIAAEDLTDAQTRRLLDGGRIVAVPAGGGSVGATGPAGPTGSVEVERSAANYTTEVLAQNAYELGWAPLSKSCVIAGIATDQPARVRVYATDAAQTADAARAVGVAPTGNHGVILDVVTSAGSLDWQITPAVLAVSAESPPTDALPITVTNLGTGSAAVSVDFLWIALEPREIGVS